MRNINVMIFRNCMILIGMQEKVGHSSFKSKKLIFLYDYSALSVKGQIQLMIRI